MFIVKLDDGSNKFLSENDGFKTTYNKKGATPYRYMVDFILSYRFVYNNGTFNIDDKMKKINVSTCKETSFVLRDEINKIDKDLLKDGVVDGKGITFKINKNDFNKLLLPCAIGSSQFLYAKDKEWIAFPVEEDYKSIELITFYKRGIVHGLESIHKYRNKRDLPYCYQYYSYSQYNNIGIVKRLAASSLYNGTDKRIKFVK